jgi:hypothetical protein
MSDSGFGPFDDGLKHPFSPLRVEQLLEINFKCSKQGATFGSIQGNQF